MVSHYKLFVEFFCICCYLDKLVGVMGFAFRFATGVATCRPGSASSCLRHSHPTDTCDCCPPKVNTTYMVRAVGFEPTTNGLKGRYSATELRPLTQNSK